MHGPIAKYSNVASMYDCAILIYRLYSCFTLEAILATAFGRRLDIQKGESDEFSKAMDVATGGLADGQFEQFILFNSE